MTQAEKKNIGDQAEARRTQILDAATECFRMAGFHSTSMATISRTAGMSIGHIYHYFESKEAIIAALVERESDELNDVLNAFHAKGDFLKAMLDDLESGLERCGNPDKALLKLETVAESVRNPAIAEQLQHTHGEARRHLSKGLGASLEKHGLCCQDLDDKVTLISAIFGGLSIQAMLGRDVCNDTITPMLRRAILAILEAEPPSAD